MKLIVGLGNPGPEYSDTRHNVGFWVTGELADRHKVKFRQSARWQARTARIAGEGESEDVLLAEPTTFMNLSGRAVRQRHSRGALETTDREWCGLLPPCRPTSRCSARPSELRVGGAVA